MIKFKIEFKNNIILQKGESLLSCGFIIKDATK